MGRINHWFHFSSTAQIVNASGVKNLNQQQMRNVNQQPQQQQQQQSQIVQQQRPRSVPTIATTSINAKQLTTRGLIASPRNIAVASNSTQLKIATPITSKEKWNYTFLFHLLMIRLLAKPKPTNKRKQTKTNRTNQMKPFDISHFVKTHTVDRCRRTNNLYICNASSYQILTAQIVKPIER